MFPFEIAKQLLLAEVALAPVESVPLASACGLVLREPLVADRPQPPFHRVMMDGYALRFSDWQEGVRSYEVTGSGVAGRPAAALSPQRGCCQEIMTGAPLPDGADCVIPVEQTESDGPGRVKIREHAGPAHWAFVHRAGSDVAAGAEVVPSGARLGSREIGVAASFGYANIMVSKQPRIAVVATGDELVPVYECPAEYQLRQSNAHSLAAALARAGHAPEVITSLPDDGGAALPELLRIMASCDWLVLTGAVSKGARDFVPETLGQIGCRCLFHGVAQRPGKPAGAWIGPEGQIIIALPGNPVSALTGLHALVLPALARHSGVAGSRARRVALHETWPADRRFTIHLPVALDDHGRAVPAPPNNSGDYIGLLQSDGFVSLPPDEVMPSLLFPFIPWL